MGLSKTFLCLNKNVIFLQCWSKCWEECCVKISLGGFLGRSFFMNMSLVKTGRSSIERRILSMIWWSWWKGTRHKGGRKEFSCLLQIISLSNLTGPKSHRWTHQCTHNNAPHKYKPTPPPNDTHLTSLTTPTQHSSIYLMQTPILSTITFIIMVCRIRYLWVVSIIPMSNKLCRYIR